MANRYRTLLAAFVLLGTVAVTPAQASAVEPVSVTFAAAEDVFISQAEPAKSFATATWMSVCGTGCGSAAAGQRVALTRFEVTGLPADAEDVKATLEVVSARTTDTTVSVRPVTGSWTEAATTWNTRPAFDGPAVGSHTGFTAGATARLDVSSAVPGNGTYALALTGTDATATVLMSSRETGNRGPKLTLTYTRGGGGQTAGPLPFTLPGTAALRASGRKVFAHYFTPYPISLDNRAPDTDYYARNYLNPDGESGKHAAYGGLLRDRPVARAPISGDYALADLKTEVSQAIAAGLDGFTVDILSVTSENWTRVRNLVKAAEAVDPGFKIVLMPDTNGLASVDSAALAAAMAELAASESVFRLADGRLVVAPFKAEGRTPAWWSDWMTTMETRYGIKVALVPCFLDFNRYRDAFAPISYGFANWGNRNPAANASLGANIDRAHDLGKIWMQPVSVQDERPNQGIFDEAGNTENLRATWKGAIDGAADWVQLTTWNDYSENTQFAPSRNAGWTYLDINAYYLTCYKLGCPRITNDTAYLTPRIQPVAARPAYAQTKLMQLRGGSTAARDTVEVLTMLTAAAQVTVTIGGSAQTYDAPAGVSARTFPLRAGTASATVARGSTPVAQVTSTQAITTTPHVQDLHYRAASSER
ncbi:endo-1,3-alpha-glucanase family glycosylhydrolase [Nonomuraea jiangxiensis]|uniref:Glycosyl hydrolase family 71 n=1 Tax=Nonomuraea jiangxiensis TaxID=633440 RepID=A0A1G9D521_9ACTN|nr:endo-1,3-alpha-glucanase family glycosylhydrolase [Nonomuraea jiangxiensis]SDK58967.1 Glycosyl hydrolase family 71 [Nonomuraea jiangxiensis]